ncbi:hypothetical protein ON010_g3151 [Phytophthora cinnamomi]|nr:hypothetical protein ON010_g3151 [Phytophthora cinnamomi]
MWGVQLGVFMAKAPEASEATTPQVVIVHAAEEGAAEVRDVSDAVLPVRHERVRVLEDEQRAGEPRGHGHDAEDQQRPVREEQDAHGRDAVHGPAGAQVVAQAAGQVLLEHGGGGRQHAAGQVQPEEPAVAQHVAHLAAEEVEPQHVGAQVAQRGLAEHGGQQQQQR